MLPNRKGFPSADNVQSFQGIGSSYRSSFYYRIAGEAIARTNCFQTKTNVAVREQIGVKLAEVAFLSLKTREIIKDVGNFKRISEEMLKYSKKQAENALYS